MSGSYRLTFNKPAVDQLLVTSNGEAADGLQIRLQDGVAQFHPVLGSNDDDVLPLDGRSRGGVEAVIDGDMGDDLVAALQHDKGPFMALKRVAGGWLEPTAHQASSAPSKFVPHLRLWTKTPAIERPKKLRSRKSAPTQSAGAADLSTMLTRLREAKSLLDEHRRTPRRGQPPRAVKEAKAAMQQFEAVVVDFMPEIGRAHELLERIVCHRELVSA